MIVGNEPNLNLYWLPQFDANGGDAAATGIRAPARRTYDALKAADPSVGRDRRRRLAARQRQAGREAADPLADDVHPRPRRRLPGERADDADHGRVRLPPVRGQLEPRPRQDARIPTRRPSSIGDYGKLVALLGEAFDGTAQPGSTLPIYYDEFGVQTTIPPDKAALYSGAEPALTRPVDPATQAVYYRQAVQLAFCEPTVRALFLFHTVDETDLHAWQSGLYYADGTPKASLPDTRLAIEEAHRGVVARCPGLHLAPNVHVARRGDSFVLHCSIDCRYVAQLWRLPGHLLATRRGRAPGGSPTTLSLTPPATQGRYRLRVSARAPINPGRTRLVLVNFRHG